MTDFKARPNRFPLPPLLLISTMGAALLLHFTLPIGWAPDQVGGLMRGTGALLIIAAFALDVWAFRTLKRHNTTIMPNKAASQLAVDGPFAHSRNPIYLGNVMLCLGAGFLVGSRWFVLAAVALFFMLSQVAIKREEKHLAANFPDEWEEYSARVRRWV